MKLFKCSQILLALSILFLISSCNDDDEIITTEPEPEIELPNFVAYNTGMTPILPEGIEFDTDRESFIISSAAGAGISLVALDGTVSNLVAPSIFGGNGIFGLQIDKANDRLLAVSSSFQNPMIANLFIFKLSDGSLINNVSLANLSPGLNFVNDVAIDSDGNAYVSNSDQGIIFKVTMDGDASIFFQDNTFTPADATMETGFNGIEYHPDGYLIVSHYVTNKIFKLELSNLNMIEVALPAGFILGGDGIYLDGNELVVVNNAGIGFISKFETNDDWSSAMISGDTYPTGDIFPTAVVKVGNDYMVNNAYLNYPAYANNPVDFLISKANFDFNKRYSGTSTEIPRINTPLNPFGYGNTYPNYFYTDCTTTIASGLPDLQGDWTEQAVTIGGAEFPAQADIHTERIEQCGNRILIISAGVLHEVFIDDDSMYNGVNDVNPQGQPTHASGRFENSTLILTPIFPSQSGIMLPDVTRKLIQDDSGTDVLKFFNPQLQTIRYMKKN